MVIPLVFGFRFGFGFGFGSAYPFFAPCTYLDMTDDFRFPF